MMSDVREVVNSATSAFERVLVSLDGSSVAEAILPHAMTTHGRGASRRIRGQRGGQGTPCTECSILLVRPT